MSAVIPAQRTIGIIGAAIAGPTFALQILSHPILSKAYKPILFGRSKDPRTASEADKQQNEGVALEISGNGLFPLYQLGLKEAIEAASTQAPDSSFWLAENAMSGNNSCVYLGGMNDTGLAKDLQRAISFIERQKLQSILLDKVEQGGGRMLWNHGLQKLERLDNNKTRAIFDNATYDLDLLVGADGALSTVRKHILNEINPSTAEDRWSPENCGMTNIYSVSSNVEAQPNPEHANVHRATHGIYLSPGILTTSPLPQRKMKWNVVLPEQQPVRKPADSSHQLRLPEIGWQSKIVSDHYSRENTVSILQQLAELPNPVTGTFGSLLASSGKIVHTPLSQRVWEANEIQKNNVVLIGDASRVMLPSSSQGTSFAIEDATVLANALVKNPPSESGDHSRALKEYAAERVPRSKKMASMAYWSGMMSMGDTWYWRLLRSWGTWFAMPRQESKQKLETGGSWPFNARYTVE